MDLQENMYKQVKQNNYMSVGVGLGDLNMVLFLDVQNQGYSQILYLIDYVVPELHFW